MVSVRYYGTLGDRMKKYESMRDTEVLMGVPKVLRLDMVAGHTFTKHMEKPYDLVFHKSMEHAMSFLCKSIQSAVIGYTQSDEITIILNDSSIKDNYAPYYSNRIQKITSVAASRCTTAFISKYLELKTPENYPGIDSIAFDARVFEVPDTGEVYNCLLWRVQDAHHNAWNALAQANYTHERLQGVDLHSTIKMLYESGVYDEYVKNGLPHGYFYGEMAYKACDGWVSWFDENGHPLFDSVIVDKVYNHQGVGSVDDFVNRAMLSL